MSELKNPLASRTVWGGIIMALPLIASFFGYNLSQEKIGILNAAYDGLTSTVGLAIVLYGRWRADTPLGFKSLR